MMLSVSEIAKTPQYKRDRLDGVSAEDAIERARSSSAFRRAAIQSCEEAARKVQA
jgi:hypothetical protein